MLHGSDSLRCGIRQFGELHEPCAARTDIDGSFHFNQALAGFLTAGPFRDPGVDVPDDFARPQVDGGGILIGHLRGQPLNNQLCDLRARFVRQRRTAPSYRLYALGGISSSRAGLMRVPDGGSAIEVEVWEFSLNALGRSISVVPPPLAHRQRPAGRRRNGEWIRV
jgi:hypothetical protein